MTIRETLHHVTCPLCVTKIASELICNIRKINIDIYNCCKQLIKKKVKIMLVTKIIIRVSKIYYYQLFHIIQHPIKAKII